MEVITRLQNREEEQKNSIANLENKLESLESQIKELESRGITADNLTSILDTDIGSASELQKRVKTVQDHNALKKKTDKLTQNLKTLNDDIKTRARGHRRNS